MHTRQKTGAWGWPWSKAIGSCLGRFLSSDRMNKPDPQRSANGSETGADGDRGQLPRTHGVTYAENARGDFFGNSRLETLAAKSLSMEDIFSAVANFCGGTPLSDDCTVVDLVYSG